MSAQKAREVFLAVSLGFLPGRRRQLQAQSGVVSETADALGQLGKVSRIDQKTVTAITDNLGGSTHRRRNHCTTTEENASAIVNPKVSTRSRPGVDSQTRSANRKNRGDYCLRINPEVSMGPEPPRYNGRSRRCWRSEQGPAQYVPPQERPGEIDELGYAFEIPGDASIRTRNSRCGGAKKVCPSPWTEATTTPDWNDYRSTGIGGQSIAMILRYIDQQIRKARGRRLQQPPQRAGDSDTIVQMPDKAPSFHPAQIAAPTGSSVFT